MQYLSHTTDICDSSIPLHYLEPTVIYDANESSTFSQPISSPLPFPQPIPDSDLPKSNHGLGLNISKEEVLNLLACIPVLNKRFSDLEINYAALENKCASNELDYCNLSLKFSNLEAKYSSLETENAALRTELSTFRTSSIKRHNNGEQYTRRNSLVALRLRNVPTRLHGTEFSIYVAKELNRLIPGLALSNHDIDTSHILYYEHEGNKAYPAVVIKFICRDLKNDILNYYRDGNLDGSGVHFSEHLTVSNRKLFESAQRDYQGAWTEHCKIFVNHNGRKKEIVDNSDLAYSSSNAGHSTVDIQAPFSSRSGTTVGPSNQSNHQRNGRPHHVKRHRSRKGRFRPNNNRNLRNYEQHISRSRSYSETAKNSAPQQWPGQPQHAQPPNNQNQFQNANHNIQLPTRQTVQKPMCNPIMQTHNYSNPNLPSLRPSPQHDSQSFHSIHNPPFKSNMNDQFYARQQFSTYPPQFSNQMSNSGASWSIT